MAKATKRWAVRQDGCGGWYMIFSRKPRKPKTGWHQQQANFKGFISSDTFEGTFPDSCHLDIGGGPVEIRFAEP